jgi:hypothetical protein
VNKLIISLFLSISFLFVPSVQATVDQEVGEVGIIAQIISNMHSNVEAVWPGYDINETPTIITFRNGHVYALDLPSKDPNWKRLKNGRHEILYSAIDHWGVTRSPMNADFPIDNSHAFVFQLDGMQDPILRYLVFVHERFHSFQGEHYTQVPTSEYRDASDVVNLSFIQLEDHILADFMRAKKQPDRQMELIRDFVAVNSVRSTFIHQDSVQWENEQQRMEGMADYVSMKVFVEFPLIQPVNVPQRIADQLKASSMNEHVGEQAIKWRHYSVGNALGFILDFLSVPDWKQQIQNGSSSLVELIKQTVSLAPDEISQRLERVEAYYHLPAIYNRIGEIVGAQEDSVEQLEREFVELPGVRVNLGKPFNARLSGGGSHLRMVYLSDGSTLSIDDISSTASSDNQWSIKFQNVPFLVQNRAGFKQFKIDDEVVIFLDDKPVKIKHLVAEKNERRFNKLSWKSRTSEFSVKNHPGLIRCDGEGMTIEFTGS